MKTPETPVDEAERLATLRSLNILDTPPEERFDRLTRLAKRMFDVPIALVSLVDEDRQWFKSCTGLEATETSREISFCGHAILDDRVFMIPDALEDERFFDNPLVTEEPFIRFYGGCPLRFPNGHRLGTLCLIDTRPREFDEEDLQSLRDLAELAERELVAFQLATLDDLTKISNRRGFISLAQKSLDICRRHEIPASLVYFDLDSFKPINDQYGHAEGDNALKVFAEQMRKAFRDSDVFGRIGGDEFALLLTNTDKVLAEEVTQRFCKMTEAYNNTSDKDYQLQFSHGIATTNHQPPASVEELLEEADGLMYKNKTNRRQ